MIRRCKEKTGRDSDAEPSRGERRPYAPPRILSADPLEIAAAACEDVEFPATFGKTVGPGACTTLGS